jgi:hypothetical protein
MCARAGVCARSTANWRHGTFHRRGRAGLVQLLNREQAVCLGGSAISGQCTQILERRVRRRLDRCCVHRNQPQRSHPPITTRVMINTTTMAMAMAVKGSIWRKRVLLGRRAGTRQA